MRQKNNYDFVDIFGFETEVRYSDMVVISCVLNDSPGIINGLTFWPCMQDTLSSRARGL